MQFPEDVVTRRQERSRSTTVELRQLDDRRPTRRHSDAATTHIGDTAQYSASRRTVERSTADLSRHTGQTSGDRLASDDQRQYSDSRVGQVLVVSTPIVSSAAVGDTMPQTVEVHRSGDVIDELYEHRSRDGAPTDGKEDSRKTCTVSEQFPALSAGCVSLTDGSIESHSSHVSQDSSTSTSATPPSEESAVRRRARTMTKRPIQTRTDKTTEVNVEVDTNDDGLSDEDDEGVYDETFRYSTFIFIGDTTQRTSGKATSSWPPPAVMKATVANTTTTTSSSSSSNINTVISSNFNSRPVASSSGRSHVTEDKFKRSMSLPFADRSQYPAASLETKSSMDRKTIQRQFTMMTYVPSDRNYAVERILTLSREDSISSYGFHISGSDPVVISTVEPGSIADREGVLVGDRIVTVNDAPVVNESQDVVRRLISSEADRVQLGVAAGTLSRDTQVHAGYVHRFEGLLPPLRKWHHRWMQIKSDGFLYICKNETNSDPLGAIGLLNCVVIRESHFSGRDHVFKIVKYGKKLETHYFQCHSPEDVTLWASIIHSISTRTSAIGADSWLDVSSHNVGLSAMSIRDPDCHGFLTKVGNQRRTWRRRYCVLKNACLYYYRDPSSTTAKGVAHLHGYLVQDDDENRRFGFQLIPPIFSMRHFQFTADNETDMKRWMAAMSLSIGKWIAVQN